MKKILPVLVLLAFGAFCYQVIVTFFVTGHEVVYSLISTDQKHYTISEIYKKIGDHHYYSFLVKNKNKTKHFSFAVEQDFNKQERVITDIEYYKRNNLECIFPIYKRNHSFDVSCLLDGKQVSSYYLVSQKNEDFSYISNKFSEKGYDDIYFNLDEDSSTQDYLSIYDDYIPDDFIFAVWNYRGIDIISKDNYEKKEYLNYDYYENKLSTVVGKYYVTVNTDKEEERLNYYQLILYNLNDGGKSVVDVDISQDSYFNGVVDGILYITDPKAKIQYSLDPNKKEFKELKKNYEVSGFELKKAGKDFFDSPKVDSMYVSNKQITKLYDTKEIKKNRSDSYFKTDDGKIYRVIQKNYKHPILICQFDDIKEWQVHDDGVSFIVDDTLYLYTDFYGLKPIISNLEFRYNYKNIYSFIREE